MRVAICAQDIDERYAISRLVEDVLLRRGTLPEISLFPMLPEMIEAARLHKFDAALICDLYESNSMRVICQSASVILVGFKEDGITAFDVGARYFVEAPATAEKITRALARCLSDAWEKAI